MPVEYEGQGDFTGESGGGLLPGNSRACFYNLDPPLLPRLEEGLEASGEGHQADWDGSKWQAVGVEPLGEFPPLGGSS